MQFIHCPRDVSMCCKEVPEDHSSNIGDESGTQSVCESWSSTFIIWLSNSLAHGLAKIQSQCNMANNTLLLFLKMLF